MRKKLTATALICALMAVSLWGCGTSDAASKQTDETQTDTAAATSVSETAAETSDSKDDSTIDPSTAETDDNISSADLGEPAVGSGIYYGEEAYSELILTSDDPYEGVITDGEISEKTVTLYQDAADDTVDLTLYFVNQEENIPYISMTELTELLNTIFSEALGDPDVNYEMSTYENIVSITRENGAAYYIDLAANTISSDDYDLSTVGSGALNGLDVVVNGTTGREKDILQHSVYAYIGGNIITFNLDDYGIHMAADDQEGYIPLATANDLFICTSYYNLVYNGESAFLLESSSLQDSDTSELTELGEIYYSVETKDRPQALIDFTYRELCLALDMHYGLKSEHGITNFNDYFVRTGLYDKLTDADPSVFYEAIQELTLLYFADRHSGPNMASAYAGNITTYPQELLGAVLTMAMDDIVYSNARMSATGSDSPAGYEEYGDTAFITFDQFTIDRDKDYASCTLENDPSDTVMLILYADQQIKREDSPIKNIVIDLSNNIGGDADAAAALVAWYLGAATFQVEDVLTGAISSAAYSLDVNYDGKIDDSVDTVKNYNLYCLISPVSFSCGNLVPAFFKQNGYVTLIGKTSGGGACVVQPMATADGCLYQCSGRKKIATATNGSYYSVDQGVTPDIYIDNVKDFYDKDYIQSLIEGEK